MTSARRSKKGKRKPQGFYSKGELNYAIDSLVHPLIKRNKAFILLDEAAHAIVEQNPEKSIEKFVRYRLPALLKDLFFS